MLLRFQKEGVYQDVLQIGKHRHSKTWQGHPESSATEQGAHGCIGLLVAFSNHCFPERISQIVFVKCADLGWLVNLGPPWKLQKKEWKCQRKVACMHWISSAPIQQKLQTSHFLQHFVVPSFPGMLLGSYTEGFCRRRTRVQSSIKAELLC